LLVTQISYDDNNLRKLGLTLLYGLFSESKRIGKTLKNIDVIENEAALVLYHDCEDAVNVLHNISNTIEEKMNHGIAMYNDDQEDVPDELVRYESLEIEDKGLQKKLKKNKKQRNVLDEVLEKVKLLHKLLLKN
jgi:DNA polymerase elongation subunit (family B)